MKMGISEEVISRYRDAVPTSFSFKISSFSKLAENSIEKVESNGFDAGGYKWKLILYPNGNQKEDGGGYISMYLEMVETSSLPHGWELNVCFRFFVYDQVRDKYLILGDMGGSTQRFHGTKAKWGFSKLLLITTLNDPSTGFLVNDTCAFGAEVHVCKFTENSDCLSMVSKPMAVTVTHKLYIQGSPDFMYQSYSQKFMAGGLEWKMTVFFSYDDPNANEGKDVLSVKLCLAEPPAGTKVCAAFKFRLKNQINDKHKEHQAVATWFKTDSCCSSKLIGYAELMGKTNGFVV